MHTVYVACLAGGFVATVLFAALGALGGAGHGAGHLATGHSPVALSHHVGAAPGNSPHALPTPSTHAHAPAPGTHAPTGGPHSALAQVSPIPHWLSATAGWTLSWLSPLSIAAAALLFGGVGLVADIMLPKGLVVLALLLAVLAALLGAAFVRVMMAAFVRSSTPPLAGDAVGAVGTVNAAIRPDALGEVVYTLDGLHCSVAARSLDNAALPRGTNVVIVRREGGVAWVSPLDPLAALDYASDNTVSGGVESAARQGDAGSSPP